MGPLPAGQLTMDGGSGSPEALDGARPPGENEGGPSRAARRLVEVAVDAAGVGSRTYTYHLPPSLSEVRPGEVVLVEYGRRQALGIVLGEAVAAEGGAGGGAWGGAAAKGGALRPTKPVLARVRADGPLMPDLSIALTRWISSHYLAPPAVVIRALLPPGLLERLELIAAVVAPVGSGEGGAAGPGGVARGSADTRKPGASPAPGAGPPAVDTELPVVDPGSPATAAQPPAVDALPPPPADGEDAELLGRLRREATAVRDLPSPAGRAELLRRLHSLEARGLVSLEWTLTTATGGPRYERWVVLEPAGEQLLEIMASGQKPPGPQPPGQQPPGQQPRGRPLGPRQAEALAELGEVGPEGLRAAILSDRHGAGAVAGLERRGLLRSEVRERPRNPLADRPPGFRRTRPADSPLTPTQLEAVELVAGCIAGRDSTPLLLEGVTGGGKTAVYAEAIAAALEAGRPALVLVPEIALALPLVDRLRAELDVRLAMVHSGLGQGERADEWRRIRAGAVDVVVGTRLAVLSPLADVGLVIVDEEHDSAYKSDRTPRLQARDTAIELARLAGAAVILGSATPAVDSVGRANAGRYRRIRLPERPTGSLPHVAVVDLRAELAEGNRGLLSRALSGALGALDPANGERAILVMNRRGSASVVLCRDCGHVQACPECQRPLVFHQAGVTLRCHLCGTASPLARRCPACHSPRIRYLGGGTERIEAEVRDAFPGLRVGRLDRDVVERKGAAARVVDAFAEGRLDVLVGTSLVTKGLDIPQVTLVGIVSADVALNLPDERASERTYQLLAQAVGRAGRGDLPARAILQTYQPMHPAIQAVASGDAGRFYEAELALRRRFGSPPFGRLVKLTVGLPDAAVAQRTADEMAARLRERAAERGSGVAVVGPAPAYAVRRAGRWRWNLVLRGDDPVALLDGGLPAPWSVDVDPESLL